jgi:aldehyde dehydrogenase (NAD+)
VVNVVTSSDHLVGEELTLDPRVDMISFTGSTVTGKRIMERGAATLKRVFLELGGKSAMIVLDDADFASVVPSGMSVCMHAGQGCSMQTRMLLPRSRYEEGVELITAAMKQVPYGDPTDPNNMMGPVISAKQRARIEGYIQKGVEEGAKLVVGGGRPAHLPKGWFVEPTLFVDVDNSMTIAQEEIFGPVLTVIPYDDDEDAIRIANDSAYGLSGGIFSASNERAMSMARRLRVGSLGVNGGVWYSADSPYGGYKASGVGRQNGIEGFETYLETKAVAIIDN